MTEIEYLIAISTFTYLGPARIKLLVSFFKSAKNIWYAGYEDLLKVGISQKKINEFILFREKFDFNKYFEQLEKQNIYVTTFLDKDFPKSLKDLDGAPVVLYFKGSLKCLSKPSVAIIGTRKMTLYGKEVTKMFSGKLGKIGVTIISGLARGIDTEAHKSCLVVGGNTIAILGHGLDQIYPPENRNLANEIVKKGGAIISEFPIGYPIRPENFIIRNRIVSGLSSCVLVIEGAEKSGTLTTATHAAEQGKTVFAVPGDITSPLSKAPLFLLKNGARIATEVDDILEELKVFL